MYCICYLIYYVVCYATYYRLRYRLCLLALQARNRHGLCCDQAMAAVGIPVIDSHSPSIARPDKTLDGYHYFDRHTEDLDAAGVEVCIGNSVARTLANLILNAVASL